MKYAFIRAHRGAFGVRAMCRVLRVHFICFYAWIKELLNPGRAPDRADPTGLGGQRQGLWLSQADGRSARSGRANFREPSGPLGIHGQDRCIDQVQAPSGPVWRQASHRGREQVGAAVPSFCPRSGLGSRNHLHQDPRELAVSVCRHRPVLAPRGRLVCAIPNDHGPRPASFANGRLATKTRWTGHGAFRSGFTVHQAGVADVCTSVQSGTEQEPARKLP
ncbi:hypothetical protein SAMN04488239_12521 [Ruegeria marina]|uniref:Uncharacterized protein n=1 Tax=Ruegeria marina TaxID=639004 RepID=A0A1G7EEH0_9RHOB|nr:hypothetical protein SAMN04488239_12521 [Ruegeria marina]